MQLLERLDKETGREYAFRIIKKNIISLDLAPGSMVSENELASQMGLSRTPVRETLIELSKSGIVEIYPQKGSRVSKIKYNLVEEARFIRLVFENAIVELACEMATPQDLVILDDILKLQEFYIQNQSPNKILELDNAFHRQLFQVCNKMQTYNLMDSMSTHFDRIRSMSLNTVIDVKILEDHRTILDAISAKDAARAKQAMVVHLSRYKVDELAIRQKYPDYFE